MMNHVYISIVGTVAMFLWIAFTNRRGWQFWLRLVSALLMASSIVFASQALYNKGFNDGLDQAIQIVRGQVR
jgi:hypothetical protein